MPIRKVSNKKSAFKLSKRFTDSTGKKRALVTGIGKRVRFNTLAKRYSKRYQLPAFYSSGLTKRGQLLLIQRKKPLSSPIKTFNEWERR